MPFRSVVTAAGGRGSIAGTAEDAARWMQAFAGGRGAVTRDADRRCSATSKYTRAMHAT